jgi:DNA-binding transcriptional MerR regulator
MSEKRETFSISELAAEFGVTPRTIRFYEDNGLISPARQGQSRVFAARDRARLMWILRGRRVGFSLAEVAELIDLYDLNDDRVEQRRMTLKKCRERQVKLIEQRNDLDATISELDNFCQRLEQKLAEAGTEGAAELKSRSA